MNPRQLNLDCFDSFPELHTDRLRLRAFGPEDAAAVLDMNGNPRYTRFLFAPPMESAERATETLKSLREGYASKTRIAWAALLRDHPVIIGGVSLFNINASYFRAEIGGGLHIKYWGKGLPQEAVTEVLRFGFEEMGLHTIEAKVSPQNRGAIQVLESFGFVKEAHFRDYGYFEGAFNDMAVYTCFEPAG